MQECHTFRVEGNQGISRKKYIQYLNLVIDLWYRDPHLFVEIIKKIKNYFFLNFVILILNIICNIEFQR